VHDLKFNDGEPLTFELHLEVRPNIEIPRSTGFRVERKVRPVSDEQLQEQLEELREDKAVWTPVGEKPIAGDMVTVQLAMPDDAATDATAEPREYRIVLGTGQALPAIEEVITETAPGATTERPVKWPEDFPDEEQRGKTKTVRVTVEDVKRKTLPELDDDFARATGDFESMAALRDTVREDLVKHAEREADADVRQKLVDEIIAANPFDIPQSWVNRLVDAYLETYQIPEEERERFRNEFRPLAERQVRRDLVVSTIAKNEGLEATEADIDERVMEVAEKRGTEPGQVYASLEKAGRIAELERNITEEKVFAWLMEKNTVEQ
jgi:trigger factor